MKISSAKKPHPKEKEKTLVGIITKSDIVRAFTQVESNAHLLEKYKRTY